MIPSARRSLFVLVLEELPLASVIPSQPLECFAAPYLSSSTHTSLHLTGAFSASLLGRFRHHLSPASRYRSSPMRQRSVPELPPPATATLSSRPCAQHLRVGIAAWTRSLRDGLLRPRNDRCTSSSTYSSSSPDLEPARPDEPPTSRVAEASETRASDDDLEPVDIVVVDQLTKSRDRDVNATSSLDGSARPSTSTQACTDDVEAGRACRSHDERAQGARQRLRCAWRVVSDFFSVSIHHPLSSCDPSTTDSTVLSALLRRRQSRSRLSKRGMRLFMLFLRPKLPADFFLPTQAWYNQKGAHIFGALYLTLVWVSLDSLARISRRRKYLTLVGGFQILVLALLPRPLSTWDKVQLYALQPATTVPMIPLAFADFPQRWPWTWQLLVYLSVWLFASANPIDMYRCDFFIPDSPGSCDGKDFQSTLFYASAMPVVALFALGQKRIFLVLFMASWVALLGATILRQHQRYVQLMVNGESAIGAGFFATAGADGRPFQNSSSSGSSPSCTTCTRCATVGCTRCARSSRRRTVLNSAPRSASASRSMPESGLPIVRMPVLLEYRSGH